VALKQCHADDSPKLTPQAQVSSSLHAAERPALPLLAQLHRKHQPELMVWLPSSVLRVLLDSLVRAPHSQRVVSLEPTEPREPREPTEQRAESSKLVGSSDAVHLRRVGAMSRLQLVVEVHHHRWVAMNCQAIGFALMNHQEPVVAVHRGASMAHRRVDDLLDRALPVSLARQQHLEHSVIDQDYESEDQNSVEDAEYWDRPAILHLE
jgi:hypothetical protein